MSEKWDKLLERVVINVSTPPYSFESVNSLPFVDNSSPVALGARAHGVCKKQEFHTHGEGVP